MINGYAKDALIEKIIARRPSYTYTQLIGVSEQGLCMMIAKMDYEEGKPEKKEE